MYKMDVFLKNSFLLKVGDVGKRGILILCSLFLLFPVQQSFSASAQDHRVSLDFANVSLATVLKSISDQTSMSVVYNSNDINTSQKVSIKSKNESVAAVLDRLLNGTNVSYSIQNNHIVLSLKKGEGKKAGGNQDKLTVSGTVKDTKGASLIGVSVWIKGTTVGTTTDVNGNFKIPAKEGDVLSLSYIGFSSQQMSIKGDDALQIVMHEDSHTFDEVVVTALGIKRQQKALSYNVQQVSSDDLVKNKDANFINSLSGKVAGVTINASSSGIGGASKVVMRGTKGISQSSNALYVIDGVPMFNLAKDGGTEFESTGSTEAIADINPEDIESMSVLTGAAAAALYGSHASNGAVVITTKKGKAGSTSLSFSHNSEFLNAFVMPKFQNRYGTGSLLSEVPVLDKSWGQKLNEANYMGYSPKNDYFNTGVVNTDAVTFSTGTDRNQTYVSASTVTSKGIIPNNEYNRINLTYRNTTSFFNDKMHLDLGGSYIKQDDINMINQGIYSNPLVTAYLFPRGDDWSDIQMFERYNSTRKIMTQYWPQGINEFVGQNPYWINYRNLRKNSKDRYMMNANLSYNINSWLSVSGRARFDNSNNKFTEKFSASTNTTLAEGSKNGLYGIATTEDKQTYADVLVSANKTFFEKLSLQANVGASISDMKQDLLQNRGPIREDGIPNVFNVFQLDDSRTKRTQSGWREQTQSVFGSVELGYKSAYYLTLTGRNDWPSQLAGPQSTKASFFYPSVGTSFILSEIFKLPEEIKYLKLRASFASVGLPFARFLANPTYEWDNNNKVWQTKTNYPMYNLKPERTDSWEVGLTAKVFGNFNLDVSVYDTKTYNQTFDPKISVSSGYSTLYVQTGSVQNRGIELSLGYKNTWSDLRWSSSYTLSANKNKILELVDNYVHPETGVIITKDRLDIGGMAQARFILKKGGSLGDLYSITDLQRDSEGNIYIDPNGNIAVNNKVGDIKLGSVFPKCNMAWRNDIGWKNFNVGFMFSARLGGIVYSATQAALDLYGVSDASAVARDNGGVVVNGGDVINAQKWYSTIGAQGGIPQYYTYSATNVRLQEASIEYTIPKSKFWKVADVTLAVVGKNLWMIYNKAPFDPEAVATTGNYYQGIDYFMMPTTRNIGFNVRLKF